LTVARGDAALELVGAGGAPGAARRAHPGGHGRGRRHLWRAPGRSGALPPAVGRRMTRSLSVDTHRPTLSMHCPNYAKHKQITYNQGLYRVGRLLQGAPCLQKDPEMANRGWAFGVAFAAGAES